MSRVSVGTHEDPARALRHAFDDLGLDVVDKIKAARSICIVSGESVLLVPLVDVIRLHTRTPIHVLTERDAQDTVESSISRGGGIRMPIRRPSLLHDADFVIILATMTHDVRRRTELALEQYLFQTWYVPNRTNAAGFLRPHDPWLEGELRDDVLADLYMQRPIDLALLEDLTTGRVFASFDALALDAVVLRMTGVDPDSVGYLSLLEARGVGTATLSKIDVPLGVIEG